MMLLRFRFENHKSFRDPTELTMLESRLKTTRPTEGTWSDYTLKVAGIYGPNASGKSSVLDALHFMTRVVRHSATRWAENPSLPNRPFALDESSKKGQSHYAIDMVIDDVRYEYGFGMSAEAIHSEWLYEYPAGRRRILFERNVEAEDVYRFGRALKGGGASIEKFTGERELFLSRAAASKHPELGAIFRAITSGIKFARFDESDRMNRMRYIIRGLASGRIEVDDLVLLLQVADVGIGEVEISKQEVPEYVRTMIEALYNAANSSKGADKGASEEDALAEGNSPIDPLVEQISRNLAFHHRGEGGKYYPLEASEQSTGTLSWLSLAVPAVEALRRGTILLVDELDASLHPQLAQVLIQMFRDRDLNRHGAQLIFTTHDTYFLSSSSDSRLTPEEVWFAEKNNSGVSDLYSLGDFSVRSDENFSRRYLHGRYGATPSVAPSFLEDLVHKAPAEEVTA